MSIWEGIRELRSDGRGVALTEFALVVPVFLATLLGMAGYGGYFWRAHAVQQMANNAARAALPGLTVTEREALVLAAITSDLAATGTNDPTRTTATVTEAAGTIRVMLQYDGSKDGFLNLTIVPLPSKLIKRVAAVRMAGL